VTDTSEVNARARQILQSLHEDRLAGRELDELLIAAAAQLDDNVLEAICESPCYTDDSTTLLRAGHAAVEAYDSSGRPAFLEVARSRLQAALAHIDSSTTEYGQTAMVAANVCRTIATHVDSAELAAQAVRHAQRSIKLLDDDPHAWWNAATALRVNFGFTSDVDDLAEALQFLDAAIDRADEEQCSALFSDKGAVLFAWYAATRDTDRLAAAVTASREAVTRCVDGDPNSALFQGNLCMTLRMLAEATADRELATQAITAGIAACTLLETAEPSQLLALQDAYLTSFDIAGEITDLDHAVHTAKHAVAAAASHPDLLEICFIRLSRAWLRHYSETQDIGDLDAAVDAARDATESDAITSGPDAHDALAIALATRFERHHLNDDLRDALAAARDAVDDPDHAEPRHVVTLANVLVISYEDGGSQRDLDDAITLLQDLIARPSAHVELTPVVWSNLGAFLTTRHDHSHQRDDLENAVSALQYAISQANIDAPTRGACLVNLANAYMARFDADGNPDDLDEAIDCAVQAVDTPGVSAVDRITVLATLALALRTRFDVSGDRADIDAAIAAGSLALARIGGDDAATAAHILSLSAGARRSRFGVTGDPEDLRWAREAAGVSVANTDAEHRHLPTRQTVLASCLLTDFEVSGNAARLDEATTIGRTALPRADTTTAAVVATNLGNALLSRYELRGWPADIASAVEVSRQAVQGTPKASPFLPGRLSNLGNALRAYAADRRDPAALDEAVTVGWQSVQHPDLRDPEIGAYWSNLGLSLSDRFETTNNGRDLDEAISALREAAQRVGADHPSALLYRTNLAMALRQRFVDAGRHTDIEESVDILVPAARDAPRSHPHTGAVWLALGNALHSRFLADGDRSDYADAQRAWLTAAESTAPAATRLTAAESSAVAAEEIDDRPAAADGFRRTIELVPLVAWHGLDRSGREQVLSNLSALAGSACAAALSVDDPQTALENLEGGRSVLWKQLLDLRRDFTDLQGHDDETAVRLRELSRLLDRQ
jgi:tetratricopeptide (TPR) repeat protein